MNTQERINVASQTMEMLNNGFYINKNNQRVEIKEVLDFAISQSKLYKPDDFQTLEVNVKAILENRKFHTAVEVINESTIAAAIRLANEPNLACLNFASAKNPGGGFLGGAQAQEESIARASGLYPCINQMQEMYSYNRRLKTCLYSDYTIFSKDVPIIRNNEDELLDNFFKVSIITAPAVNTGVVKQREPENIHRIEDVMRRRITMILNIALVNNIEALILGAWGCGVFQNDPNTIAQLFAEQLNGTYNKAFKKITFAILDNPKKATIATFEKAFHLIQ